MDSGGDDEQSNDHRSSINVQQQQQRSSASAAAAIVAQVSSESEELPAETPQRSSSSSASNSDRQRIPPAQLYETQVLIQRLACFVYGNPITRAPMYTADSSAEFSVNDAAVLTRTLDDLEALAHHIDIGVWLTQPLPPVECPQSEVGVILSVRSTMHLLTAYYLDSRLIPNGNIRELAARTVGAAIQNNPKVRQWALDAGTVPPILGEGDSESTVHSLMDRLLQLLCGGEERDKAVQSSLIFALLAIVRQNEPAISRLQTADLQCLFQTTVYQNNHLKLLKKGLQLTADLLAFNTPSGFVGHSGHQHRRLPVDWSQLANWVASHFRLFCLQPQGMLLEICLIACEALIALTRSADQQLLRTNVALRDAFDLANHRWFSADGAADSKAPVDLRDR
jgi:hypothetical protein